MAVLSISISSEQIVQEYDKWLIPMEMDDDEHMAGAYLVVIVLVRVVMVYFAGLVRNYDVY